MKKKVSFIALAVVTALTAGCTAENELESGNNPQPVKNPNSLTIDVADAGIKKNGTETRVAYSGLTTTFETGDAIGVYAVDADGTTMTANAQFTLQKDGTWVTSETVIFDSEWSYYAYYPYVLSPYTPDFSQSEVNDIFSSFITDSNNKFHKTDQSTKANYAASDLMIAKGTPSGSNKVIFSMYHKKGLAVLSGDGMSFFDFSSATPYTNGSNSYFLMKPSTETTIGGVALTAASGKYVSHVYDMASVAAVATDISMYNTEGTLQGSRSTANCYMIHDAGIYKLPLVYGNAITKGYTLASSFQAPSGSGIYRLANFKNHAGQDIFDPWIKNNYLADGSTKITVDEAQLLWQDANGLIDVVGVSGIWLVFRVPEAASSKQGNALIAALDDGDVVWSWHIWCTTETYASTTTVNTSANTYNVTGVNLGWIPADESGKTGYCPYYQWGRKDPFISSTGTSTTSHTAYDIDGNSVKFKTQAYNSSTSTLAYAISNPALFITNNSGTWENQNLYNYWDSDNNVTWTRTVTNKTSKTVYDPCPPGFCVPTQNLYWYYFGEPSNDSPSENYTTYTNAVWDATNKGVTVLGNIWYPAAGYRSYSDGTLYNVGSYGNYWSASPSGGSYGGSLRFNSSSWYCYSSYRTDGRCVRPVSE